MELIKKKFNNCCIPWENDAHFNEHFLGIMKMEFDRLFETRGWLFLRDIYELFGLPITKKSCVLGWHVDGGSKSVLFEFSSIHGTNDYELTFLCYPILEYFYKGD